MTMMLGNGSSSLSPCTKAWSIVCRNELLTFVARNSNCTNLPSSLPGPSAIFRIIFLHRYPKCARAFGRDESQWKKWNLNWTQNTNCIHLCYEHTSKNYRSSLNFWLPGAGRYCCFTRFPAQIYVQNNPFACSSSTTARLRKRWISKCKTKQDDHDIGVLHW